MIYQSSFAAEAPQNTEVRTDEEGTWSGFQIVNKLSDTDVSSCLFGSSFTCRTEPTVAAFGRAQLIRPDVITDGGAFDD
jgi:hypothetical protein